VLLKRSGVNQLILSVESGSERVLKSVMKKPLKLEIVKRVANDCRDIGIYTDCNILIGLPGETKSDIKDTLEFLKTIDADWFRINVATPLAGSEMYDICEDKNYFKEKPLLGNFKKAIVETPEFTSEYIQETSYMMNIELNFVNNSNMRFERYSSALDGFRSVLRAKYDHPLAHYYSGVCLKMLGDMTGAKDAFRMAKKYSLENEFWMKIINKFNILIDV